MAKQTYDVVVIGSGVIGSSITFELGKRGFKTLTIDKNGGAGLGSTSFSSAIVRFTYSTYAGVAMSYEGLRYWENWSDHVNLKPKSDLAQFHQCGMVSLKDGGGHHDRVLPFFDAIGIPYEHWSEKDFKNRLPELDLHRFGPPSRPEEDQFWDQPTEMLPGGLFTPEAGFVSDPQLAAENLRHAASAIGCNFQFNAEVVSISRKAGHVNGVVLRDGTTIATPVVINAAGPHSRAINQMAGALDDMTINTSPLRQEVHHVPAPRELEVDQRGVTIADDDNGIYVRPDVGKNILVGSTEPDCDPLVWVDADHESEIDPAQWEAQVLRLNRRIPAVGVPHRKKGVVGVYDVSDDWIPIYDRTCINGFYVAIGTSGNQFKNAAVAGFCMSELVEAVEGGLDHDSEPLVVTGPHTSLQIDMGNFRRTRQINPDSSMSVHG
ncbi:MAG: FAD-binding oxidoreductase [Acidimicrobiales bacterium]|jgi:sarcosine oxidase subunit beta|nr:FAD-binding oxidoreductase [Acidimicrobiales bacterium]HCK74271.1 FAD-dependent oxidoreductase [Acidimicrobiaceae bacterium]|tara:strand:- start:6703 stop:8007 length:1305 start_codon:yes stop_codon:yes gene_type:complete